MDDKLKTEISAEVDKIFAGKKEEDMRKRTEVALEESASAIESLTSDLESERVKIKELKDLLSASEEAKKTLEDDKSEAASEVEKVTSAHTKEVEELKKEVEEKTTELDGIKKDAVAASRIDELTSAGVARDEKEDQAAKVREMSDEEFVSYRDELVSVRASILAELDVKKNDTKVSVVDKEEKADDKGKGSEEKTEIVTPPVNIDPGTSVAAALNMEIYPSDDLVAKYTEMGKAMAEAMIKDK